MTFTLGVPQIIMIALYIMSLGLCAVKHNKPREDKYNFWVALIGTAINITILKWGGFF